MNKKQRLEAIKRGEVPDYMPVFPFILTHGVYSCGWTLPDITTHDHLDGEKSARTVLETLKNMTTISPSVLIMIFTLVWKH